MLFGQFGIHEGLPLLLESLDTRDGTLIKNWTSVAYACDKILSAEPPRGLTQGQHQVREEYLKWKATLPERSSDSSRELRYFDQQRFFKYERAELPSYRSLRRRHERATAMGAPVDHVSYGTVIIEIPPEGSDGWEIAMRQPRPPVDIVAFARRFLEAGQST